MYVFMCVHIKGVRSSWTWKRWHGKDWQWDRRRILNLKFVKFQQINDHLTNI